MSELTAEVLERRPEPRKAAVGRFVEGRLQRLLGGAASGTSATRATLANLRGAVARDVGSVPEVWEITLDGAPGRADGDEPTAEETAIHAALTLFAVHQQSRDEPMHRKGVGLGQAVRRLEAQGVAPGAGETSPVRRRFDALATAVSLTEARHHLRGLVDQMSAKWVSLDYAALAEDLFDLQFPQRAAAVRLRWARQYYRIDLGDGGAGTSAPDEDSTDVAIKEEDA